MMHFAARAKMSWRLLQECRGDFGAIDPITLGFDAPCAKD
jgi:hypothetical protein